MANKTKIEWVDHSASPWHGCAEVHKGCDNCYARTMAKRNPDTLGVWGPDGTRVKSASFHANCRRWNEQAKKAGKRATVFPSICDPFEDWQGPILDAKGRQLFRDYSGGFCVSATQPHEPMDHAPHVPDFPAVTMDDLRRKLFATIDACSHLDFILLTKRPENVRQMWKAVCYVETVADTNYTRDKLVTVQFPFRKNIWLLTSVSDQETADTMIPHLLACRDLVPVLGLSCEPLLGTVDLSEWVERIDHCASCDEESPPHEDDVCPHCGAENNTISTFGFAQAERYRTGERYDPKSEAGRRDIADENNGIDWVICGGESGHGARPYDLAWPRSIIGQCKAAGVPVFHKQLGSNPIGVRDTACDACNSGIDRPRKFHGLDCVGQGIKDPKGGDMSEWPEDLRVREYPKVSES